MRCRRARDLLTRAATAPGHRDEPAVARHLAACPACERFAERWAAVRHGIAERRSPVTPDAGFADRVAARLEAPADPLAWAVRRLLPATLALTLVLGGWCLLRTPAPASVAEALADGDLLGWVAADAVETR